MSKKMSLMSLLENELSSKKVILLSGLPGSGKTTFIKKNFPNSVVCSADHYFEKDGEYKFDPAKLGVAHGMCQQKFKNALNEPNVQTIVVDNTFTQAWEAEPYISAAKAAGVPFKMIRLNVSPETSLKRNTHGVPETSVRRMHANLQKFNIPNDWDKEEIDTE